MKKATCLFLLFFVFTVIYSQVNIPDTVHHLTKQDYLLKSKHQKIAAWSLLGGGFVLGIVGTAIAVNEAGKGIGDIFNVFFNTDQTQPGFNEGRFNTGLTLMLIGDAASITSIPLFISSAKKKKKAASLSITNQLVRQISGLVNSDKIIPMLTIKIRL